MLNVAEPWIRVSRSLPDEMRGVTEVKCCLSSPPEQLTFDLAVRQAIENADGGFSGNGQRSLPPLELADADEGFWQRLEGLRQGATSRQSSCS